MEKKEQTRVLQFLDYISNIIAVGATLTKKKYENLRKITHFKRQKS